MSALSEYANVSNMHAVFVEARRGCWIPGTEATGGCELGTKLGSMQKQPVL